MGINRFMEAWVDVGGTFTDCFLVDSQGVRRSTKILSTGLVPISVSSIQARRVCCSGIAADGDGFWIGSQLRALDRMGKFIASSLVVDFDATSQCLYLETELAELPNVSFFELASGLEAPVLAVRRLAQVPLTLPLPPLRVRLGTTRGTNALLTRRGAATALAITAPFEDLLRIGDQTRAQLFQLKIPEREILAKEVLGICERLDAKGNVLLPLDEQQAVSQLARGLKAGCDSLAICLMHSYLNPCHELKLEKLAGQLGYAHVSRSSLLAPLIEIVARAQTTSVDAYLSPVIRGYLAKLVDQFGGEENTQLLVMTSSGGLVDWKTYSGKDSILSGPAGGAVALAAIAQANSVTNLLGLDMGGTSTDVCRVGNASQLQYESSKAGVRILTPTLPIETVASGGGSVCWFDGISLRVGPHSAGAQPGPACYGRGGPLTITDLNVFLGRLPTSQFPFPLDIPALRNRLQDTLEQVHAAELPIDSLEQLAEGFRRIANQQMAEAVRSVTVAEGVDPRLHALLGFGGAAGQHICEVADLLGIVKIFDTAEAGMLSALGMGLASLRKDAVLAIYTELATCDWQLIESQVRAAEAELVAQLASQCQLNPEQIECSRYLELRYQGTDIPLVIKWQAHDISTSFQAEHQRKFGYMRARAVIELVSVRIEVRSRSQHLLPPSASCSQSASLPVFKRWDSVWIDGERRKVPVVLRDQLVGGQRFAGPAVLLNAGSTVVIETAWHCEVLSDRSLKFTRPQLAQSTAQDRHVESGISGTGASAVDPVDREVYAQRLMAIATQMGLVLQKTAISVNVKQRRDFSCAVFDAHGSLLANAPHVPVHLGAMGVTVRAMLERFPRMVPGDSFITNDPYQGGSHLPDVTVVTPVFSRDGRLMMFTASRAHHADIGGKTPGSMSILATKLGEEGVIIPPMYLTCAGEDRLDDLRRHLQSSLWPPRNLGENLADIAAQQAANARGAQLIEDIAAAFGWSRFELLNEAILQVAAQRVAHWIDSCERPDCHFMDHLDDGTPIAVHISFLRPGRACIDFTGTGDVSSTNFNANPSIVTAAVMYVLRCLIADEFPLNEGVLRAIDLVVPKGILNPPGQQDSDLSPAVAAGNVETSQRIVDVLLGALQVAAASQGTMNNLLFGNESFGFYETIGGGAGATQGNKGASGVHTHMTNTRLTDPEVLEARYPVRLERFGLRTGSGGSGRWSGGDGIIRAMRFQQPVMLSLLTSRRHGFAPYGMAGGLCGAVGSNILIHLDGTRELLPSCCQLHVSAGETLEIQTPGGGGYGTT